MITNLIIFLKYFAVQSICTLLLYIGFPFFVFAQSDQEKIDAKLDQLESEWIADFQEEIRIERAEELAWQALHSQRLFHDAVLLEQIGDTLTKLNTEIEGWSNSRKGLGILYGIFGLFSGLAGDIPSAGNFIQSADDALTQASIGEGVSNSWIIGYANDRAQMKSEIETMLQKFELNESQRKQSERILIESYLLQLLDEKLDSLHKIINNHHRRAYPRPTIRSARDKNEVLNEFRRQLPDTVRINPSRVLEMAEEAGLGYIDEFKIKMENRSTVVESKILMNISTDLANSEAKKVGYETAWLLIEASPSILTRGAKLLSKEAELIALLYAGVDINPRPNLQAAWRELTVLMELRSKRLELLVQKKAEDMTLREEIELSKASEINLFTEEIRQSGIDDEGLIDAQTLLISDLLDRRINRARTISNRWAKLEQDAEFLATEFTWLASEAERIEHRSDLSARVETASERTELATLSGRLAVMSSRLEEQMMSHSSHK